MLQHISREHDTVWLVQGRFNNVHNIKPFIFPMPVIVPVSFNEGWDNIYTGVQYVWSLSYNIPNPEEISTWNVNDRYDSLVEMDLQALD